MHFWQSYFVPKFKIFLSVHYRRVHYACTVFGGDKVGSVHLKCLIKFLFFTFLRKVFCKVVEWFILFANQITAIQRCKNLGSKWSGRVCEETRGPLRSKLLQRCFFCKNHTLTIVFIYSIFDIFTNS